MVWISYTKSPMYYFLKNVKSLEWFWPFWFFLKKVEIVKTKWLSMVYDILIYWWDTISFTGDRYNFYCHGIIACYKVGNNTNMKRLIRKYLQSYTELWAVNLKLSCFKGAYSRKNGWSKLEWISNQNID